MRRTTAPGPGSGSGKVSTQKPSRPLDHRCADAHARRAPVHARAMRRVVLPGDAIPFPAGVEIDAQHIRQPQRRAGIVANIATACWLVRSKAARPDIAMPQLPIAVGTKLVLIFGAMPLTHSASARVRMSSELIRTRADAEWVSGVAPKIKGDLVPTAIGSWGIAISGLAAFDSPTSRLSRCSPQSLPDAESPRMCCASISTPAGNGIASPGNTTRAYGAGMDWRTPGVSVRAAVIEGRDGSRSRPSPTRSGPRRGRPAHALLRHLRDGQAHLARREHPVRRDRPRARRGLSPICGHETSG